MDIQALPVGSIGTNCYLIREGAAAAVIDPGGDAERIIAALADTPPAAVLLTHAHYDHTGAVAGLVERWPELPVYHSPLDRYDDPRAGSFFPPLPGRLRDCGEGDEIAVGPMLFTVLSTPGHSAGSVTFRCGDDLFCGDTLFAGSCGRTDLLGGDSHQILASLRRLGELPGNLRVWPGHLEPTELDAERAVNPYLRQAMGRW